MSRKRTRASIQIDETQNKFHCEEAKELFCEKSPSVDKELVREFYANLTSSEMTEVPVLGIKVWFYFIQFSLMPSSHGTTISLERMVLFYSILTGKTIDVGKIILREIWNCVIKHSSPTHFPFTITMLYLKAEILANARQGISKVQSQIGTSAE
ncbi:hypothetical protein PVK06_040164 [Gossypium arboreum]|uniref:Putative plant transposon protein domain-containing protein n=1 Tax=Gossypium arboreum TaxID=29729 RepID=A0ABR0N4Q6_GOSAR|nr:hypothetical protein PVK06_040164 [Gossypium arboreum]